MLLNFTLLNENHELFCPFAIREAIQSLEKENEELMKDNTLAGSFQNQNQVDKWSYYLKYNNNYL